MPIYLYACQFCHQELEALQKISDDLLTKCPSCGEEKLVKMLTSSSFHLSGGGWFRDEKTTPKKPAQSEAS
jgi:putative FmdB family regulatory protein